MVGRAKIRERSRVVARNGQNVKDIINTHGDERQTNADVNSQECTRSCWQFTLVCNRLLVCLHYLQVKDVYGKRIQKQFVSAPERLKNVGNSVFLTLTSYYLFNYLLCNKRPNDRKYFFYCKVKHSLMWKSTFTLLNSTNMYSYHNNFQLVKLVFLLKSIVLFLISERHLESFFNDFWYL